MKKLREVASELGLSNRALMNLLHQIGYKTTSFAATLSDEIIEKCKGQLEKAKEKVKLEDKQRRKVQTSVRKSIYELRKEKEAKASRATERKVRETISKIKMGTRTKKYGAKGDATAVEESSEQKISLSALTSISELASLLEIEPPELLKKCLEIGVLATLNKKLDFETATLIAAEYGCETKLKTAYTEREEEKPIELLDPKPPVVTVMGHVDHGKTALLDYIRHTNIISKEAGGITQSIGAYRITVPSVDGTEKYITFIDTPGHKAFTAMRARGAKATDIVILLIAADEGVMPQTIEAINHAKDAGVPIIVAINKIDIPNIIPGKIEAQLMEHGVVTEKHGGEVLCCYLSAKTGEGVKELLEVILMQAELLELHTSRQANPSGFIIESKMDKAGPITTVILSKGILKIAQPIIAGKTLGKVRMLYNEWGEKITSAEPAQPVQIIGFAELPEIGNVFSMVADEKVAREISKQRKEAEKVATAGKPPLTLEKLQQELKAGEIKELKLIIKGDTAGATEALADSLEQMHLQENKVIVIHKGVGMINESDALLATASNAIIIGYNVTPDSNASKLIKEKKVEVRTYQIIYEAIEDIELALKGLLPPRFEEQKIGKAEIRQVFKISTVGFIAGCTVLQGKVIRGKSVRLIREGNVLCESKIASLKRFKDQAKEVDAGLECGIGIENSIKLMPGDILEVFELKQL